MFEQLESVSHHNLKNEKCFLVFVFRDQIDLACDVLTLCLGSLDLGQSTSRYGTSLERALNHPKKNVKIMTLKELIKYTLNPNLIEELCLHTSLLKTIVSCIEDNDIEVAKYASDIITSIGKFEVGLNYLLLQDISKLFQTLLASNEIVRLRVYEILINIAKESEALLNSLEASHLLISLTEEFNNNDVLLLMNIMELLSRLAVTNHGYKYLETKGVLMKIFKNSDPFFYQMCEPSK